MGKFRKQLLRKIYYIKFLKYQRYGKGSFMPYYIGQMAWLLDKRKNPYKHNSEAHKYFKAGFEMASWYKWNQPYNAVHFNDESYRYRRKDAHS